MYDENVGINGNTKYGFLKLGTNAFLEPSQTSLVVSFVGLPFVLSDFVFEIVSKDERLDRILWNISFFTYCVVLMVHIMSGILMILKKEYRCIGLALVHRTPPVDCLWNLFLFSSLHREIKRLIWKEK